LIQDHPLADRKILMNPLALLLPNHRASVSAFVLGIVILLVVDAVRLSVGTGPVPGLIPLFAVWFVCFSLFANRRRHAGRSIGLAFLPVVLAIVAKGIGAMVGAGIGTYEAMLTYATEQGVAVDDQAEMTAALQDPGFQTAFQDWLQGDLARTQALIDATTWPSFIAFWVVLGVFAIWFSTMHRNGSAAPQS
jgi:hypothetical protein